MLTSLYPVLMTFCVTGIIALVVIALVMSKR